MLQMQRQRRATELVHFRGRNASGRKKYLHMCTKYTDTERRKKSEIESRKQMRMDVSCTLRYNTGHHDPCWRERDMQGKTKN